jgi:hypothetical protein
MPCNKALLFFLCFAGPLRQRQNGVIGSCALFFKDNFQLVLPARAWATDFLPLSLASGEVPNMKNEAGKAAMWTAVFVSPGARHGHYLTR